VRSATSARERPYGDGRKCWQVFRGAAARAAVITATIWVIVVAFSLFPAHEEVTIGEDDLPPLSPTVAEHLVLFGAVLATLAAVFVLLVAVSRIRSRPARLQS